ncbi:MAG: hypothetical protein WKG00_19840 [Polyangiaceae bacterium]
MKDTGFWKASTLVLAGALALVLGHRATVPEASADPQPHMKAALATLVPAKNQLAKASHDKAGHRVKAIALTDQAIDEVKKGMAADNLQRGVLRLRPRRAPARVPQVTRMVATMAC